jgi:hypothetical protein
MDGMFKIFGLYVIICIFVALFNIAHLWYKVEDGKISDKSAARRTLLLPFWFLFLPLILFICGIKWLISMAIWGKK